MAVGDLERGSRFYDSVSTSGLSRGSSSPTTVLNSMDSRRASSCLGGSSPAESDQESSSGQERQYREKDADSELAAALSRRGDKMPVLTPLLDSAFKRLTFGVICIIGIAVLVHVWSWWIPLNVGIKWPLLSYIVTFLLARETFDMTLFYALLFRAKIINKDIRVPRFRVAMIATKVPSEPLAMLQKTLTACLNQDYPYPYDVWLADERPDQETQDWCAENGVRISCRFGVPEYHRPVWPRRTRCKEGNLAYFYDNWGYDMYDVVAQFDADHVPTSTYLSSALPAFLDKQVGYVACPSICDANKEVSWAVRGRLYYESYLHGAWGASLTKEFMPCCIGSHYVVRTQHLKAAGGLGPELDEDMTTSYIMTANGFKGVFGLNTIAHGDGPVTFEDCMHQEYQWARSAMLVLTCYLYPWYGRQYKLNGIERARVVHWMIVWLMQALYIIGFPMLAIGLTCGYLELTPGFSWSAYVHLMFPLGLAQWVHWMAAKAFGWLRPYYTPFWSWEMELYRATRNYYICIGVVHGLMGGLLGINFDFKVTPKGDRGERLITPRNLAPLLIYSAIGFAGAWVAINDVSFMLMVTFGSVSLGKVLIVIVLHYRENHTWSKLPYDNLFSLLVPVTLLAAAGSYSLALKGI